MCEPLETNHASVEELTGFEQYYYKNRERLLQQQRERRASLKDTPEFKQRRSVYNQRYREKSGAAAYMRDYYHLNKGAHLGDEEDALPPGRRRGKGAAAAA